MLCVQPWAEQEGDEGDAEGPRGGDAGPVQRGAEETDRGRAKGRGAGPRDWPDVHRHHTRDRVPAGQCCGQDEDH